MTGRLSLRARVVLAAGVSVVVALALVLTFVVSTFAERERDTLDRRLTRTLEQVARPAQDRPAAAGRGQGRRGQERRLQRIATRDDQGLVITTTKTGAELARYGLAVDEPALAAAGSDHGPEALRVGDTAYRAAAATGTLTTGAGVPREVRFTVLVATDAVESRISALRSRVIVAGIGGLLLAVLLATGLSRLALRRLDRLRAEADALSEPGSTQLLRGGPREIDQLAGSLNAMLERLARSNAERDEALETSRRFAADAGHELRTPLATMGADLRTLADHGSLEPADRELVGELRDQHARMGSLLDALQALARGDAGATIDRVPVDIGDLADAAVEAARARHPAVAFGLDAGEGDDLEVRGWPEGLRLAIDNLLENAARHGAGAVVVRTAAAPDHVELVVDDDGPGIPPDEREVVIQRFARGRGARGDGSGLGLALVDQQVRLHAGSMGIGAAPTGGARITIGLPRGGRPPDPGG